MDKRNVITVTSYHLNCSKQKGFENCTSAWVPWDSEVTKLTSRSLMFLKVRRMTVVFVGFFRAHGCDACRVMCAAIPLLKCYLKIFFFLNLPVRCPQAKIPEQLSLPPLLPAVLSFHPLPSVFIFCWKKENRVPSKLPNIHFEIYPLPPPPNPSQIHIYLYFTFFPPYPFPSCPCVAVGPLLSLLGLILFWLVNVETSECWRVASS